VRVDRAQNGGRKRAFMYWLVDRHLANKSCGDVSYCNLAIVTSCPDSQNDT
jgi:hypothetical protein